VQFLRRALFTRATPTNYTIRYDFNCHINERETLTTCLTNHKSSISHHITPLVINSLGGGHTHTHAYRHRGQKQFQETMRAPTFGRRAPGLKIGKSNCKSWTELRNKFITNFSWITKIDIHIISNSQILIILYRVFS